MGLDATVYLNLKNLPAHLRETVTVDPESGEMDLRDTADYKIFLPSKLKTWPERIANIAMVAFIREEISRAFGNRETLLSKKVVLIPNKWREFHAFEASAFPSQGSWKW